MNNSQDIVITDLDELISRVKENCLTPEDLLAVENILRTFSQISVELANKNLSIENLKEIIFGAKSEKAKNILKGKARRDDTAKKKKKQKGHGRNGADKYTGAEEVPVSYPDLKSGDPCPEAGCGGKVYTDKPRIEIRVKGHAPFSAKKYILDALRCNICQATFVAPLPADAGEDKYDETAASILGVMKYGSGLPLNRLAKLQDNVGIPLATSTQWDILDNGAAFFDVMYQQLFYLAAQGHTIHNDDTTIKILSLMKENQKAKEAGEKIRTGMFTTGIVSLWQDKRIALFFSGRKHAGENADAMLSQRESGLGPPIQMCDALSQNIPKNFEVILALCMAHGRRNFVKVYDNFPVECEYVINIFKDVYYHDHIAKTEGMSADERLAYHQEFSGPLMDDFHKWMEEQFEEKRVEPNSTLGKAIKYMLKHWKALTLFLREAGAPLDNNIVERCLKLVIMVRKNSLFFKTENGAQIGDIYLTLIHTCYLCKANPVDYLNQLQRNFEAVCKDPKSWLPWNYTQALGVAAQN